MRKSIAAALIAFGLLTSAAVQAEDAVWQGFDALPEGDRQLAQEALAEMFGENVSLWPEWLEPSAVYIPPAKSRSMLIVRFPMKKDCGPWGYLVLSPVTPDATRTVQGEAFCANDITLVEQHWPSLPDIQFDRQGFQDANGDWSFEAARWRWDGKNWLRYPVK